MLSQGHPCVRTVIFACGINYWSLLQIAIGVCSKDLLESAPNSYWSLLQRAIRVCSKELGTTSCVPRAAMRQGSDRGNICLSVHPLLIIIAFDKLQSLQFGMICNCSRLSVDGNDELAFCEATCTNGSNAVTTSGKLTADPSNPAGGRPTVLM